MLSPQQLEKMHGVFDAPRGVDLRVAKVMFETYGFPPWERDEQAAIEAEIKHDEARIEKIYQKFLEDSDHG